MNRKAFYLFGLLTILFFAFSKPAFADKRKKKVEKKISIYDIDTLQHPIPLQRKLWHDKIDKEQRAVDAFDGSVDGVVYYEDDTLYTRLLTTALLKDVDHMQKMIENFPSKGDAFTDEQNKVLYLRAVWHMLNTFNLDTKVDPYYYRRLVTNMHDMLIASYENRLDDFVKGHVSIYTIENGYLLLKDHPAARAYVYKAMGKKDPVLMIRRLSDFADESFADDIIADAARIVPNEVFNYASSTNYKLRTAVRRSQDPLVQTIVLIADRSAVPLKAMPFLSDIYHKRKTIAEVDAITANADLYFQNLVRLKVENDSLGGNTYTDELAYRALKYVREMDDLHESPDKVRFKCIDNMSPVALYFIMVYGQDEIYTSSFLGAFHRMLERMKPMTGDQLLDTVHYEHFRTFIRMSAGYNTLSEFLATMNEDKKTALMKDFIAGLDKGKDDDLEDAVDVADAFGSIKDSALAEFLNQQVKENYELSFKKKSRKGMYVYALLATLFEGSRGANNDSAALEQSAVLHIPPINTVPYKTLLGDTTTVVEQFFFFGDEDGKNSYASFLGNFRDGKWKIVTDKYWAVITSTEGKPVVIYANLPIPEPDDEEAQNQLCKYLADHNIHPTVIVHRGHSYHLPVTLDHLTKETKIVVLGSCGGYHNLSIVLDHSPDAHIISSKQTGTMAVNEPIIKEINTRLLAGDDINWISMWKQLDGYFDKKKDVKDKFSDYVPPYKNLGAIFIKAYRRVYNSDLN